MRTAALLVLVAGCGGSDNGGANDMALPTVGSPEAFCNDVVGALTAKVQGCCSTADQQTSEYALTYAFIQAFGTLCSSRLAAAVAAGRIDYNDDNARACLALVEGQLGGACGSLSGTLGMMKVTCAAVTTGKQGAGQPCRGDVECQEGLTCVGFTDQSDGACQQPGGVGAACGHGFPDGGGAVITFTYPWGNHPACASGNWCDSGKCASQVGSGGNCFDDAQCQSGLTCHDGTCGTAGPAGTGGACQGDDDCQSGLFCATNVCAAKQVAGTMCSSGSQCLGRCARPDGGGQGTCAAFCGSM